MNNIGRSSAFAEISFKCNKQQSFLNTVNVMNYAYWTCIDQTAIAKSFSNLKMLPNFNQIQRKRQDFNTATWSC